MGWYSGDHHIHAAGCAHYEKPTEGVFPQDMMRHILGEDLEGRCGAELGPWLVFPEDFLRRQGQPAFDTSRQDALRRGGVRLPFQPHGTSRPAGPQARQDYPGTKRIEDWPSWGMPVLRWAKQQGAVVVTRTRAGACRPKASKLLTDEIPPFDRHRSQRVIVVCDEGIRQTSSPPWIRLTHGSSTSGITR